MNNRRKDPIMKHYLSKNWGVSSSALEEGVPSDGLVREWVFVLDTFNNEIISHDLARRQGDPFSYRVPA